MSTVVGLLLILAFIVGALKFLSFVVTGEWRLFPKDDDDGPHL